MLPVLLALLPPYAPQPDERGEFCQVRAKHRIGLRSRERRFESCRGTAQISNANITSDACRLLPTSLTCGFAKAQSRLLPIRPPKRQPLLLQCRSWPLAISAIRPCSIQEDHSRKSLPGRQDHDRDILGPRHDHPAWDLSFPLEAGAGADHIAAGSLEFSCG